MIITQAIPGFSNYGITQNGEVYSFRGGRFKKCNFITDRDGYMRFMLYRDDGKRKTMSAHRLSYSSFVGELITGMTIDHLDGNKKNNRPHNLEQVSSVENAKRFYERNNVIAHNRKLTIEQANQARGLRASGKSYQKIADIYGVHWSTIHAIVNKNYYKEAP